MTPISAALVLKDALRPAPRELTVADAAVKSGLSLADAERGLHHLVGEHRGHLRVTEQGDLLFRFPFGFAKPWAAPGLVRRAGAAIGRFVLGVARFVVRAWVTLVLFGYALAFVLVLLGLAARTEKNVGSVVGTIFRVLLEAVWWTVHPFSPFHGVGYALVAPSVDWTAPRRPREKATPFYEKVDRFVFGPKPAPVDPSAVRRRVLAEIRAQKGRVGLGDLLRVTGWSRARLDPFMSRLLLEFDGAVEVSEDGGIAYRFPEIRRTAASEAPTARPEAVWERPDALPPVTGNDGGFDLLVGAVNAFNLFASAYVVAHGLTVARIVAQLRAVPHDQIPPPGTPFAFGWVPLVFSVLVFLLPIGRLLLRPWAERRVRRENGRRAVLREVLAGARHGGVGEEALTAAYEHAAGVAPDAKTLLREVRELGGDVDLARAEAGAKDVRYRFVDLELEAKAVDAQRRAAGDEEVDVGPVVFSSEDPVPPEAEPPRRARR